MKQFLKNKVFGWMFFLLTMTSISYGQTVISYPVKNIDGASPTETCVTVTLAVDYTSGGSGYTVVSPTYNITYNETKNLSVTIPDGRGVVVGAKKLIFNVGSHVLTYTIPASGAIYQEYYGINPCGSFGSSSGCILKLGGDTSLITYYIHYGLGFGE